MNGHLIGARLLAALLVISILFSVRPASAAPAAVTFTVNSTQDRPDDNPGDGMCHASDNTCTLRAAVMEANRSSGAGAIITLPAGIYGLTIPAQGSNLDNVGDLNITSPSPGTNPLISIEGAGEAVTVVDANQIDRVFHVAIDHDVHLSGLTIRNGFTSGNGGGILTAGILFLDRVTIRENRAESGGGIYMYNGRLTMIRTSVRGNTAEYDGGGIFSVSLTNVSQSTISGNSAGYDGGGIGIGGYTNWFLENSTIYGNRADGSGGGIYNSGVINGYNLTVVGNEADADADPDGGAGGGIFNNNSFGTTNLLKSLLASNNISAAPVYDECRGTINSYGRNLIGLDGEALGCTVNVITGSVSRLNSLSLLSPLRDNFGPTWTVALLAGSNAIDGGDWSAGCVDYYSLPLPTDQRGLARISGESCDIGAFEYGAPQPLYLPLVVR